MNRLKFYKHRTYYLTILYIIFLTYITEIDNSLFNVRKLEGWTEDRINELNELITNNLPDAWEDIRNRNTVIREADIPILDQKVIDLIDSWEKYYPIFADSLSTDNAPEDIQEKARWAQDEVGKYLKPNDIIDFRNSIEKIGGPKLAEGFDKKGWDMKDITYVPPVAFAKLHFIEVYRSLVEDFAKKARLKFIDPPGIYYNEPQILIKHSVVPYGYKNTPSFYLSFPITQTRKWIVRRDDLSMSLNDQNQIRLDLLNQLGYSKLNFVNTDDLDNKTDLVTDFVVFDSSVVVYPSGVLYKNSSNSVKAYWGPYRAFRFEYTAKDTETFASTFDVDNNGYFDIMGNNNGTRQHVRFFFKTVNGSIVRTYEFILLDPPEKEISITIYRNGLDKIGNKLTIRKFDMDAQQKITYSILRNTQIKITKGESNEQLYMVLVSKDIASPDVKFKRSDGVTIDAHGIDNFEFEKRYQISEISKNPRNDFGERMTVIVNGKTFQFLKF